MKNHNKNVNVIFIWQSAERLKDYLNLGLKDRPNVSLIFPESLDQELLIELAPQADIIVGWRPTTELLKAAARLKLFINPRVGGFFECC